MRIWNNFNTNSKSIRNCVFSILGIAAMFATAANHDHSFQGAGQIAGSVDMEMLASEAIASLPMDDELGLTIMMVGEPSGTTGDPGGGGNNSSGSGNNSGTTYVGEPSGTTGDPGGGGKKPILQIYNQIVDASNNQYLLAGYADTIDQVHQVVARIDASGQTDWVYYLGQTAAGSMMSAFEADGALYLAGVVNESGMTQSEKRISVFRFDESSDSPIWLEKTGSNDHNGLIDFYTEDGLLFLEARFVTRISLGEANHWESGRVWRISWTTDGNMVEASIR